jgi:hypothetical protein
MELDFRKVEVNGAPISGSEVFEYVYRKGESTWVTPPSGIGYPVDSTDDWKDKQLTFDFGTVKIKEEWVVNFTLKVRMSGNIKVLGSTSQVTFDEGRGSLAIPDTYLTAVPEGTEKGLEGLALNIKILSVTISKSDPGVARVVWSITYNGADDFINEDIARTTLHSNTFGSCGTTSTKNRHTSGAYTDEYPMDIRGLAPGAYKVRVTGTVSDADRSWDVAEFTIPEISKEPVILIR